MKQQLTKEQSRRLIDLGVPADKASSSVVEETQGNGCSWTYPVFTIGDLLEVLPKEITKSRECKREEKTYILDFDYEFSVKNDNGYWLVMYLDWGNSIACVHYFNNELIDALFDLVVWCIDNGYIETEKQ